MPVRGRTSITIEIEDGRQCNRRTKSNFQLGVVSCLLKNLNDDSVCGALIQNPSNTGKISDHTDLASHLKNKDIKKAEETTLKAIDIIPEVGFYTQLAEIYKIQGRNQ